MCVCVGECICNKQKEKYKTVMSKQSDIHYTMYCKYLFWKNNYLMSNQSEIHYTMCCKYLFWKSVYLMSTEWDKMQFISIFAHGEDPTT